MSKKSCLMCNMLRDLARFVIAILVIPIILPIMLFAVLMFKFLDFLICDNSSQYMVEDVKTVFVVWGQWLTFRGEDC